MAERGKGGWHERVAGLARTLGWNVLHDRSRGVNDPDEPDFRFLRERVVYAEVKATGKRLKRGQKARLIAYAKAGVEAYAWWPEDEDEAVRILSLQDVYSWPYRECVDALEALPVVGDGRVKRTPTRSER